jgi:hypothetical protein
MKISIYLADYINVSHHSEINRTTSHAEDIVSNHQYDLQTFSNIN